MKGVWTICALLLVLPVYAQYYTGFEPPTYVVNTSLSGVDGWTVLSGQASQGVVQDQLVYAGTQAAAFI